MIRLNEPIETNQFFFGNLEKIWKVGKMEDWKRDYNTNALHARTRPHGIDRNLGSLPIQCNRKGGFLIGKTVVRDVFEKSDGVGAIRFRKESPYRRG